MTDSSHKHEWQPNGTVEVDRESKSPCSTWDDLLWREVRSLTVCKCGKTRSLAVGSKNVRRRGDDLRKANR